MPTLLWFHANGRGIVAPRFAGHRTLEVKCWDLLRQTLTGIPGISPSSLRDCALPGTKSLGVLHPPSLRALCLFLEILLKFLENRIELCLEFLVWVTLCHFLKSTSQIIGARIEMVYLFAVLFDHNNKNFEIEGGRNP